MSMFLHFLSFFFFLSFLPVLGLLWWHMEVPRLEVEWELQLPAYTRAIATQDPSHICNLYHSSWQRQSLNPLSEARDRTHVLTVTSQVHYFQATKRTPKKHNLKKYLTRQNAKGYIKLWEREKEGKAGYKTVSTQWFQVFCLPVGLGDTMRTGTLGLPFSLGQVLIQQQKYYTGRERISFCVLKAE